MTHISILDEGFVAVSRCCNAEMSSLDIRHCICPYCDEFCSYEWIQQEKEFISTEQDNWLNKHEDFSKQLKLFL